MNKYLLTSLLLLMVIRSNAQTTTWAGNVACLLYTHCTACHNSNGIGPFSLVSYNDAFTHKSIIQSAINNHIMPPYPADVAYQQYSREKYLTTQEISIINDWINAGGPEGDSSAAPPAPIYSSGPVIINPGFTGKIPIYSIPNSSTDLYRCFIVSNPFSQTQYVTGIEVLPGNNSAVHHVTVYEDTSYIPVQLDSLDPEPGYTEFVGTGSPSAQMLGIWTPGSEPYFAPAGMGLVIPPGARIILQIHYPAGSSGLIDSTSVNLQISTDTGLRIITINTLLINTTTLLNGPLQIPANTIDTFYEEYHLPTAITVLAVCPHSHLICTEMKSFAV